MSYRQPDHEPYQKPRPTQPTVEYARARPKPESGTKPRSILRKMFSFWLKPKD